MHLNWTLLLAVVASACTSLDHSSQIRPTHEDRWRAAMSRFDAEMEARRVRGPALSARAAEARAPRVIRTSVASAGTGGPSTNIYDVEDLVMTRPNFAAPELGLAPSGGLERVAAEPLAGTAVIDGDSLADALRSSIDPASWDEEGNSLEVVDGKLIVRRKHGD